MMSHVPSWMWHWMCRRQGLSLFGVSPFCTSDKVSTQRQTSLRTTREVCFSVSLKENPEHLLLTLPKTFFKPMQVHRLNYFASDDTIVEGQRRKNKKPTKSWCPNEWVYVSAPAWLVCARIVVPTFILRWWHQGKLLQKQGTGKNAFGSGKNAFGSERNAAAKIAIPQVSFFKREKLRISTQWHGGRLHLQLPEKHLGFGCHYTPAGISVVLPKQHRSRRCTAGWWTSGAMICHGLPENASIQGIKVMVTASESRSWEKNVKAQIDMVLWALNPKFCLHGGGQRRIHIIFSVVYMDLWLHFY